MRYFHASTSPLAAIKKYTKKQLTLLVVAFVFALSSATSLFLPTLVSALPKNQAECEAQGGRWDSDQFGSFCSGGKGIAYAHRNDPSWLAQSYWRYKALEKCLNDSVSFEPGIDNGRAASGNIFMDNIGAPKAYSFYGRDLLSDVGDDGVLGCAKNSSDILSSSLGFWGINGLDLVCDTGIYKRQENADCRNGTGYGMTLDRSKDAQRLNLVRDFLRNNVYGDGAPSPDLNNASSYVFYRTVFEKGCAYNVAPVTTNPGGDRTYEIANIEGSGNDAKITPVYYVGDKDKNYGVYTFADGTKLTCGELASRLSTGGAYATAYLAYVKAGGENNAGTGQSCTGANPAPSCGSTEPVCEGGALGWFLCPLNNLAADITNFAAEQIQKYLEFQPLLAPGNAQGEAIFKVWQIIIGIANILLVIAFLVVVFSQATSIGLSSYGIKKILPRIIAAAILMNISYFLCAVAVDASNIAGQGMKGIISLGIDAVNNTGATGGLAIVPDQGLGPVIAVIVASLIGLSIAAATGVIGGLLVLLATAATVLFTVFILLVVRQILLVLLIIVAPLAFVALVLPNTNDLFTKWRKLFVGLLLLFPITMALLYGGIFVSVVILRTAPMNVNDPLQYFGTQAAALVAIVAPLFGIPAVFKRLLGAAGRIAGFVNNPNKGLIDRSRKKADEWKGNSWYQRARTARKAETQSRRSTNFYRGMAEGKNPRSVFGRLGRNNFGASYILPGSRSDVRRSTENIADQYRELQTKETARNLAGIVEKGAFSQGSTYRIIDKDGNTTLATTSDHRSMVPAVLDSAKGSKLEITNAAGRVSEVRTDDLGGAVMSQTAKMGDVPLTQRILDRRDNYAAGMREFIAYNAGNYATKAPDYLKGEAGAFKDPKGEELVGWHPSTAGRARNYAQNTPEAAINIAKALNEALANPSLRGKLNKGIVQNIVYNPDGATPSAVGARLSDAQMQDVRRYLGDNGNNPPMPPNNPPDNGPPGPARPGGNA